MVWSHPILESLFTVFIYYPTVSSNIFHHSMYYYLCGLCSDLLCCFKQYTSISPTIPHPTISCPYYKPCFNFFSNFNCGLQSMIMTNLPWYLLTTKMLTKPCFNFLSNLSYFNCVNSFHDHDQLFLIPKSNLAYIVYNQQF